MELRTFTAIARLRMGRARDGLAGPGRLERRRETVGRGAGSVTAEARRGALAGARALTLAGALCAALTLAGALAGVGAPRALAAQAQDLGALTASTDATPRAADPSDPTTYLGWWCNAEVADSLVVTSGATDGVEVAGVVGDCLVVNLTHVDDDGAAGATGVLAPLDGSVATLSFTDSGGAAYRGTITLGADEIDVSIERVGVYQVWTDGTSWQTSPGTGTASLAMDRALVRDAHHPTRIRVSGAGGIPTYAGADSDARLLSADTLAYCTPLQLELVRDEILARHGYAFSSAYASDYFAAQDWYSAAYSASTYSDEFDYSQLSDIESTNLATVEAVREAFASASSGTTFMGTSGTYEDQRTVSVTTGGQVDDSSSSGGDSAGVASVTVSFDEFGTPTLTVDPGDGSAPVNCQGTYLDDATILASLGTADDGSPVFLQATWYSPALVNFTVKGSTVPDSVRALVGTWCVNRSFTALLTGEAQPAGSEALDAAGSAPEGAEGSAGSGLTTEQILSMSTIGEDGYGIYEDAGKD